MCVLDKKQASKVTVLGLAFDVGQQKRFAAVVVPGLLARRQVNQAAQVADHAHHAGLAMLQWGGEAYAGRRDAQGRRLADVFDGAVTEHCLERGVCADTLPYLERGKQGLNIENSHISTAEKKRPDGLGVLTLWR